MAFDLCVRMPKRIVPVVGGVVYHVVNRARDGVTLFESARAYADFIELIQETLVLHPIRILAFCVMPNHWHFMLWPETAQEVRLFIGRLAQVHAIRFQHAKGTRGSGPVYVKRFEARPVETELGVHVAARYIERNPCAAGLAPTPSGWPWSSAAEPAPVPLAEWPTPRPADWKSFVAQPIESAELLRIRAALKVGPQRRRRGSTDRFDN
jgi:putative transposase